MTQPAGLRWRLGGAACWLRDRYVFLVLVLLAGMAAAVLPGIARSDAGALAPWARWALVVLGVLAAISAAGDKVADRHVKALDELDRATQTQATNRALSALASFLGGVSVELKEPRGTRLQVVQNLRTLAAASVVAGSLTDDPRATFYELDRDDEGWRSMCSPRSHGRADRATTDFREKEDPDHPVWRVLAAPDDQARPVRSPDGGSGVAWDTKPYKEFLSVPVHGAGVTFGMLSLNTPTTKTIGETDRLLVLVMARVMGVLYALASKGTQLADERGKQIQGPVQGD